MSAPTLHPEMTWLDAANTTAEYVLDLESETVHHESAGFIKWHSLPVYDHPVSLQKYIGDGEPNVVFRIGGDMPDELIVYMEQHEDLRLRSDAYVQFFFERYLGIIDGHEHEMCIRAVAQISKQQREDLIKALDEHSRLTDASFAPAPKDSMDSDYAKGQVLSWVRKAT